MLWGTGSDLRCQAQPGVTADYFCFLLPWQGLCPGSGHPYSSGRAMPAPAACTCIALPIRQAVGSQSAQMWMSKQET